MTSPLRQAFIDYCISGGDSQELANDKVDYAIQHCSLDYHTVVKYLNELMLCKNDGCDNIEHETNMTDTEGMVNGGIGIVCKSCSEDMEG